MDYMHFFYIIHLTGSILPHSHLCVDPWPITDLIYITTLGYLIGSSILQHHWYADNTQIYCTYAVHSWEERSHGCLRGTENII